METKYDVKKYIHIAITLLLMFGFQFIPPVSLLTETGMAVIGVLLGAIYGITFCAPAWPAMLALPALVITGVCNYQMVLSNGFGNDNVWLTLMFFVFVAVLDENKITEVIATRILTLKICKGRPWVFSYLLIVGTMIAGAFGSTFPALIVFWSILISTCTKFGIEKYSKYVTVMFMGICLGGLASSSTWLFRGVPLFVNTALIGASGGTASLNFGLYAIFSFVMWSVCLLGYVLLCKYILRVDVSKLANIDDSIVDKSVLKLNKRQKACLFYVVFVLAIYCATGFIPTTTAVGGFLAGFGSTLPIVFVLSMMAIIPVDGRPMLDLSTAGKKGVDWNTVMMIIGLVALANIMLQVDSGIGQTIVALLTPIFDGKGMIFVCVAVILISVVLTNVIANMTVAMVFTPVVYTIAMAMGFNPLPIIAMLAISCHIAYLTPAACPFAALMFGYSEWVKSSDIYKYGLITCVWFVAVFLIIGIPFGNLLF